MATEPLGSLAAQRRDLDAGGVSSVDLLDKALARERDLGRALGAIVGLREEAARGEAREADERRVAGEPR